MPRSSSSPVAPIVSGPRAPDTSVGARIRDLRRARGLTQDALGQAVGVSRSAVAQWETDRAGQVRDNLGRIASSLGVSPEFLLTGESPQAATADELALLRLYRESSPADRQLLLRTARRLAQT